MEHGLNDLVLLQHESHNLFLGDACLSSIAFGVLGQGLLQALSYAQIIHDQAAGLVLENTVDAGDSLHQAVALHEFVNIHGVQAGSIEAGKPHVSYYY